MAGPIAEAFVNVRARTDSVQGDVSRGFTSAFRGIGRTVAGLAATYGLGRLFEESITSASDLNESLNAVSVSFGDLGQGAVNQLNTIGESAATNMGLTQTQFNEAAVRFNAFSRAIASASGANVIDTLEQITGRATDFASVMNLDVVEAQRLFQSGLAGETEPLRRFGIDISAARVEAYALSEGIASTYQELTESQKQMIRWQLILEQTNQMQGDFANTSEMLANALRIAKAQIAEIGISFGAGLLPGLQAAVNGFNEFLPTLNDSFTALGTSVGNSLMPLFEAIGPALATLIDRLAPIIDNVGRALGALAPLVEPVVDVLGTLGGVISDVLATSIVALTPLIDTLAFIFKGFAQFLGSSSVQAIITQLGFALSAVADAVSSGLLVVMPLVMDLLNGLLPIISPLITAFSTLFVSVLESALPVVTQLFEELTPVILEIAEVFTDSLLEALPALAEAFTAIMEALAPLIPILADMLLVALEALAPILPTIIKGLVAFKVAFAALSLVMAANPITLIIGALAALAVGIKYAYERFEPFHNAVDNLWQSMQNLWDVVTNKVVAVWQEHLLPIFQEFKPVVEGVKDAIGNIVEAFKSLFSGDFSEFFTNIKEAFQSLWNGLVDVEWSQVGEKVVTLLTAAISAAWRGLASIGSMLGDVAGKFVEWFRSINWASVGTTILNALGLAVATAWSGLGTVASWFADVIGKFATWIGSVDWRAVGRTIVNALALGASAAWNGIVSVAPWFGNIAGKFGAWISGVDWGSIGSSILSALALGVATAFQGLGSVASWFGDLVTKLSDWISSVNWDDVGNNIGTWVGQLPGKLIGWIADAFSGGGEGGGGGGGGTDWVGVATTLLEGLGEAIFALGVTLPAAVVEALAQLALGIMEGLGTELVELITGDNPVADFFKDLPNNFVDWVGDMADAGFRIASDFLLSVVQGMQELRTRGGVGGFISEVFGDIFKLDQIENAIRPGARQVREAFNDAFSKQEEGINPGLIVEQLYSKALPAINEVGTDAGHAFSEAIADALADGQLTADELVNLEELANDLLAGAEVAGESVAEGFTSGAAGVDVGIFAREWRRKIDAGFRKDVYPTFNNAPAEFNRQVSKTAPTALKGSGTSLITGLKSGIDTTIVQIRTMMAGLSVQFVMWLGNLSNTFRTSGLQLMNGFTAGIAIGTITLSNTLRGLRTSLTTYLGDLSRVFLAAGLALMRGLALGIATGLINVAATVRNIPSALTRLAPDMSGALVWSGISLMNGLYAGIMIGWIRVQTLLRQITNAIPSFKGPEDVDRELLEPAGMAIMEGFQAGLARGWRDTKDLLSGFTSSLGSSASGMGGFTPGGSGGGNIIIESPQVNFTGALPTTDQAMMVGTQLGRGIEAELNKSRIRGIARTAGI